MGFDDAKLLSSGDHRPYPHPGGAWAMSMIWHDLLFAHWPMKPEILRPMIPDALELDVFDGFAWLGVVPFSMSEVRPRFLPSVPAVSDFPEINLRTYVTAGGRPGVWFFSLDAHNPLAVRLARMTFGLPYFDAGMSSGRDGETVHYESRRTHRRAPLTEFSGSYRPTHEIEESSPGSLEAFLTERYCLYAPWGRNDVKRGEIHHEIWPLRRAEAEFRRLDMTSQVGITLPKDDPVLHYAGRLEVLAWIPQKITDRRTIP